MTKAIFSTPEDAEQAFYQAIESANIDAMMAVWADAGDMVCVHPSGPRLEGRDAIRQAWESIFSHSPTMTFRITDCLCLAENKQVVHVVYEHIRVSDEANYRPPIVATNIFHLTDAGWRMVLHHASPLPVEQLPEKSALH